MPTFTSSREASKDEMAREIDRCHKVIADLEARAEAAEERARVANGAVVNFEIAHAQPGRRIADLEARLARVLEDEAEHFIQAAIDRAPEPLRRLGEWLSKVLDEDQWATAERMLLGAATQPARVPSRDGNSVLQRKKVDLGGRCPTTARRLDASFAKHGCVGLRRNPTRSRRGSRHMTT